MLVSFALWVVAQIAHIEEGLRSLMLDAMSRGCGGRITAEAIAGMMM